MINEPTRLMYGPGSYIIDEGYYRHLKWYIIKPGITPCAYIVLENDKVKFNIDDTAKLISPHGGITYDNKGLSHNGKTLTHKRVIGWDYGHFGDYNEYIPHPGYCWTKVEVLEHIKKTIDELYLKFCK